MERTIRTGIGLALVAALALFLGRAMVNIAGETSQINAFNDTSVRGGCPSTPNCVSSYASDTEVAVDPIACAADVRTAETVFADAMQTVGTVETVGPRAWIVYSSLFRFPSDVRINITTRGIEVISASRLGSGDFGRNRARVEDLRAVIAADSRCAG